MRLKLPWSRRDDNDTEGTEEDEALRRGYEDDEQDELEDEEGVAADEEEGEEAPEALADLDDDTRARVEVYIEQQKQLAVAAQSAAWRMSFQERGFDLSPDGKPLVADPALVVEFASAFRQPTPVAKEQAAATETIEDPRPDPFSDTEAFIEWTDRRAEKRAATLLEEKLAELRPRLDQQEQWRLSQSEREAWERVQSLLPGSAVSQLGAPEHRGPFQTAFLDAYRQVPPENRANLSDDDLEQLAAFTIPKVFPRGQQKRDEQGRYAGERSRNALLYDQSHQAHPDGTRAPRNPPLDENEARIAKQYGMTPAEYRAYSQPGMTIGDHQALKDRAKGKR